MKFKEVEESVIEIDWKEKMSWLEVWIYYGKDVLFALCKAKSEWLCEVEMEIKEELLDNFKWEASQEWINNLVKIQNKATNK